MIRRATMAICMVLLAFTAGCESSTGPDREALAGVWVATTFASWENGVTTDQLAAGSSLSISLALDGTTTGQLVIQGGNADGTDLVASMAGTWTLADGTVDFSQSADTFVRDMSFAVDGNTLKGDEIFGEARVIVTLTKQP